MNECASKGKPSKGQEAGSMENAEMNYSRLLQAILDIAEEMLWPARRSAVWRTV